MLKIALAMLMAMPGGCVPDDGARHPAGPPPAAPEVFGEGVFSTDAFEWRITFTPDGRTAYFARSEGFFPVTRQATIMTSRYEDDEWTEPEVAPFSGEYPDLDPFVSPDGRTLYFSSIRPVDGEERTDTDLWLVRRRYDGSWGEPRHMGPRVNSDSDELFSSVDARGNLYFASDRATGLGGWDIYWARRSGHDRYRRVENLGAPVNTEGWEFNPTITPDGRTLLFTGLDRAGGAGLGDIWTAERSRNRWSEPVGVADSVNTGADEYHPSLSPSLDRLFFIRDGDIYQVSTEALPSLDLSGTGRR